MIDRLSEKPNSITLKLNVCYYMYKIIHCYFQNDVNTSCKNFNFYLNIIFISRFLKVVEHLKSY